ncbi:hypothetical protein R75465_08168 [Paraburkholderia aspalathi]|nr:hypothetical protein R75465_08168 [Paraburkholderia aspalathi]
MIFPSPDSWFVVTLRFWSLPIAPAWFVSVPAAIAPLPPLPVSLPILPDVLSSDATFSAIAPLPWIEPFRLTTAAPDSFSVRLFAPESVPPVLSTDCATFRVRS